MLDHQEGQIPLNLTLPSRDNGPPWTHNVFSVSSTRAILHSFSERKNPWKRWRFIFWVLTKSLLDSTGSQYTSGDWVIVEGMIS